VETGTIVLSGMDPSQVHFHLGRRLASAILTRFKIRIQC
jgi:hypothetical protein